LRDVKLHAEELQLLINLLLLFLSSKNNVKNFNTWIIFSAPTHGKDAGAAEHLYQQERILHLFLQPNIQNLNKIILKLDLFIRNIAKSSPLSLHENKYFYSYSLHRKYNLFSTYEFLQGRKIV
jgi:hypothetical protein